MGGKPKGMCSWVICSVFDGVEIVKITEVEGEEFKGEVVLGGKRKGGNSKPTKSHRL